MLFIGVHHIQASSTNSLRVTVELQDGSRVIGNSGDEKLRFRSEILGEMKLSLESISSIECQPKTNAAKLKTANGDTLAVAFGFKEIHIETSFGSVKIPVDSIRRLQVSAAGMSGRTKMGLVALWSGEGDYIDAASGITAIPVGEVSFADGKQGQSFFLNGQGAYLKIPVNSACDVGKGDGFTIEGWISPTTVMPHMPVAEFTGNSGTSIIGVQFWISIGGGPGCFYANVQDADGAVHSMTSAPGLVVPNVWQHIALTYDKASGMALIYLDGSVVMKKYLGSFTPKTDLDLLLGARILFTSPSNPSDIFSGKLDEIGIYNRALSASEIQAICTEENNGEPLPPPTASHRRTPFNSQGRNFISE